ncbi:MAG TPA: hypothetical protein VLA04_03145 [Verrucomicrobiae bacterium]|nr:hypothetical protein [Verrucomicrobiae bacterium]
MDIRSNEAYSDRLARDQALALQITRQNLGSMDGLRAAELHRTEQGRIRGLLLQAATPTREA